MNGRRKGGGGGPGKGGAAFSAAAVVWGTVLALGVMLAGSALVGLLYSLTEWESLPKVIYSFNYISAAVGGMLAARKAMRAGWLHGAVMGLLFMTIIASLSGDPADMASRLFSWKMLAILACGALGGMIGVNSR